MRYDSTHKIAYFPFLIALACGLFALAGQLGAQNLPADAPLHIHSFDRQELTDTYYSEGIAVGDIDGDEHQDVVYGPHWYAGPDFKVAKEIYPAAPQPRERYADHFFAWIYDFDSDGHNDVFTVGFPGTPAYVYRNPGPDALDNHWTKHEVFDWVSNESPHFTQLVGDERPELVCTRDGFFGYATINWSQPFKKWTFHPVSQQVAPKRFGHGLGVGDVNGDGRADIIHSRGWLEHPAKLTSRWAPHEAVFGERGGAEIYAYDVDGDGDNDIITSEAAHEFGLSWYEQTGGPESRRFKKHLIMGDHPSDNAFGVLFSELHSVALADIDGDGLKDIVTGKTYWSHHKQSPMWDAGAVVYWFKLSRDATGPKWTPMKANGSTGIGRQVTVADINADGLLDIATGGMLGANVLLHQSRPASPQEYLVYLPKPYAGPKPVQRADARVRRGPPVDRDLDGKVPDAIEGENLNATVTAGTTRSQNMKGFTASNWSGDSHLWWTGARPGDRLTLPLNVLGKPKAVELALTCARDYGIVEIAIDDQPIASPIDLFSEDVISTGQLRFATGQLKPGPHTLTIEIVGANASAVKSYMVGLDYLRFVGAKVREPSNSVIPKNRAGRELNVDFETGTLDDWEATGTAFHGLPVKGDSVNRRRSDMFSRHQGDYWLGTFEKSGDAARGTLTSQKFVAAHRYASFLVGGGKGDSTRVELWDAQESEPFYTISGKDQEDLRQVVVDLRRVEGREMFIRLVDDSSGGWGHINFDHFRLHPKRPAAVTPPAIRLTPDEYPHRGLAADEAAAAMQVPEGFRVQAIAAEPDVKQPIAFALDDRGRVWIAEAYEYPQRASGDKGRDRILIFEDTTGDGVLDSRKVFFEGLNLVSGLEVGHGGVWVGAAPYLLFIADEDKDDVADAEPKVLLDGWGYQDTHETLNAFCWGPDGWLYGCHGVFTHSKVGVPGTADEQRTKINAGVWRYHPKQHVFEVFAHGTSNPWGVDFNEYGDAFITACVIPHLYHMIPGGRYQRQAGQHFNKATYDDIKTIADHLHYVGATPHSGNGKSDSAGGGHAHAGAMIYQGDRWPEKYHGQMFMNNIHGQRLNVDALQPSGSGYIGTHEPDFLLTGDQASQILNMRSGPDGNVIMIDWYDMQACHRREVEVHDRSNGRVYKIYYGENTPSERDHSERDHSERDHSERDHSESTRIDLAKKSDLELAELCLHTNEWHSRHARRLLAERSAQPESAVVAKLRAAIKDNSDATRRLRAMWALFGYESWTEEDYKIGLSDTDPHVRGWAIRLNDQLQQSQWSDAQLSDLAELAESDASPIVRRELASLLMRLPPAKRWNIAAALIAHAEDAEDHNLPLLYWYAMEPLADENPDRALALAVGASDSIKLLSQYMLRRVAGSGGADAVQRLTAALAKEHDPNLRALYLSAMRKSLLGVKESTLPQGWKAVNAEITASAKTDQVVDAAYLSLVFGHQPKRSQDILRTIASNSSVSVPARVSATEGLAFQSRPEDWEWFIERGTAALEREGDKPVAVAAIGALARFDNGEIPKRLLSSYGQLSPDQKRMAISTLCARPAWAIALLSAIGSGDVSAKDLTADLARQLEYMESPEVDRLLAEHWGGVRATDTSKLATIEKYKQLINDASRPTPDLRSGRLIFSKTCQRCHSLYGVGQNLGPDLTGSNRKNLDYLLENIVDPSAVMAKEYQQTVILTVDGQALTGIAVEENENALVLQTAESKITIAKEDIDLRKLSPLSMMPENQLQAFSESEIRDLIAYLRSKRQVELPNP